jgi:hypothetical protein
MAAALLIFGVLCFAGIGLLIWDSRERPKPIVRPTVPMDERMPPA